MQRIFPIRFNLDNCACNEMLKHLESRMELRANRQRLNFSPNGFQVVKFVLKSLNVAKVQEQKSDEIL